MTFEPGDCVTLPNGLLGEVVDDPDTPAGKVAVIWAGSQIWYTEHSFLTLIRGAEERMINRRGADEENPT